MLIRTAAGVGLGNTFLKQPCSWSCLYYLLQDAFCTLSHLFFVFISSQFLCCIKPCQCLFWFL